MSIVSSFLIGTAQAAEAAAPLVESTIMGEIMRFLPLFLIFAVVYFLMIRPQQKKFDEQTSMLKGLQKGDQVLTGAGFVGKITKLIGDDYIMVEIAKDVEVKVVRSTISGIHKELKAK